MKVYIDPRNRWCICIEGKDVKGNDIKVWHAVPPTNGDRIDIFNDKETNTLYKFDFGGIVIVIKDGEIYNLVWTHNNKVYEERCTWRSHEAIRKNLSERSTT